MSMYENVGLTSLDYIEEILHLRKALADVSDECSKAYDKIANFEQQRWVSVKDRLPELSKEVLFCHKERIYYIYELGRCWKDSDGNIQIELDNEDCYMSLSYLVSKGYSWTELPEPPKGEQ